MFPRCTTVHPELDNRNLLLTLYGQNEIILDNNIERDLQQFLLPLNLLNFSPLPTKYKISFNYITSNSRNDKRLSVFSIFCYVVLYIVAIARHEEFRRFNPLLMTIVFFNLFLFILGLIIKTKINVTHSDINVDLILKIKTIKKLINFSIDFKTICYNWLFVFTCVLFYLIICVIYICASNYNLVYALTTLPTILSDLNMIYMIRIIKLLREIINLWLVELRVTEDAKQNLCWNVKCDCFREIIDAYSIYGKLCQIPILYHTVVTFVQCLNNVQSVISFSSSNLVTCLLLLWTIKNLALLILISYESEMFLMTLKNTQVLFLVRPVIETCSVDEEVLAYKRLRRVNRKVQVMTACGLFAADASLPLRLLSLLATYTVVLLQFAFL